MLANGLERARARADRRVDGEVGLGFDQGSQPKTQNGVIVDDEKRLPR